MAACFLSNFVRQLKTTHNSCKQFHLFTFIFNLMKKEICLSCLTVCTILLACSTPSEKSVRSAASVIPVDLEHAGALQASQWFDTIMYVPLETSDSFLFSNISHLKVSRDQNIYFISDKSFFLFDGHTGKGKLKISRLGTGPDGYASLFDSYIDPETKRPSHSQPSRMISISLHLSLWIIKISLSAWTMNFYI